MQKRRFPIALSGLVQLAFWVFFLSLPFLLRPPKPPSDAPMVHIPDEYIILLNCLDIPIFYLNAYVLIPKVLKKKGVWPYLIAILGTVCLVLVVNLVLRRYILFPEAPYMARITVFTLFPVFFILTVSTTFRLLSDYLTDEQLRKESENERLKSELGFLRSQISPHFMFNVMNSIVALSRKKSDLVEPVVLKLSELMRYMLYESADNKVLLSQEIKYLKSYVELQKLRFGEDIRINLHLEEAEGIFIEPMLLIPFVENAFKHGTGTIGIPEIDIQLHTKGDKLIFEVKNPIGQATKDPYSGIGLPNVQRRLSLLYPENYTLNIQNQNGHHTVLLSIILSQ